MSGLDPEGLACCFARHDYRNADDNLCWWSARIVRMVHRWRVVPRLHHCLSCPDFTGENDYQVSESSCVPCSLSFQHASRGLSSRAQVLFCAMLRLIGFHLLLGKRKPGWVSVNRFIPARWVGVGKGIWWAWSPPLVISAIQGGGGEGTGGLFEDRGGMRLVVRSRTSRGRCFSGTLRLCSRNSASH